MAKEKEDKDLQKYMSRIEAAERFRDSSYKDKWKRYYKRWRNYVDQLVDRHGKPVEGRSNISVPYAFVQIETVLPRLVETMFAARPYVSVKGRRRDYTNNAKAMETLLDYQHNEVFDIQDRFHIGLKIMAIYGTTIGYVGWKYTEHEVIRKQLAPVEIDGDALFDIDPTTGEQVPIMDYQATKMSEVEYDDPELKFIDLGLFYVDPNAEDIEDARYCGHVAYLSKTALEAMEERELIKLDWDKIPKESKQNVARNDRMSAVGLPTNSENVQSTNSDLFEVHYYWEDDKLVIIINRSYIARNDENPFWHKKKPYVKDTYTKVPNEFYGIGVIEMIEDQIDELNTERNMRIDYRSINLRRMWSVKRGANIKPSQLVWRQGGTVEVDDHEDIKSIEAPSITGDTFNQESIVKQDMRDATGAHDVVMGTSTTGETATSTMSKDNNASMRFKLIISSAEKRLLVGVSRLMIQLNQQYIEDVRTFPIYDGKQDDWIDVSPDEIQGEFHLVAAGSSVEPMANKEAHKQRMLEAYNVAANSPLLQPYPIKIRNLLQKVLEAMDITDTEEILPSDDELNGMQTQQTIDQFISSLPPELQQAIALTTGGAQGQQAEPPVTEVAGSVNGPSASIPMMQEQGLQMRGVGGG